MCVATCYIPTSCDAVINAHVPSRPTMPGPVGIGLLAELERAKDSAQKSVDSAQKSVHIAQKLVEAATEDFLARRGDAACRAELKETEAKLEKAKAELKEAKAELKEAEAKLALAEAKLALADAKLAFVGQLHSRVCVRAILARTVLTVCVCSGVCPPDSSLGWCVGDEREVSGNCVALL